MNKEQFAAYLAEQRIFLSAEQLQKFDTYFQLLVQWNAKMNLTSITERGEVYLKHFYDSVAPTFLYDLSSVAKIIDVGTGAGFPGIPLKICYPDLQLTLLDSLKKRTLFLEEVVDALKLEGVSIYHDRVESFAHTEHREKFDVAVTRAVAHLNVLLEYCLPLLTRGGHFIALKGSKATEEVSESNRALQQLGGLFEHIHDYELPLNGGKRQLVVIKKTSESPVKYPRKSGTPVKTPLN